MQYLTFYSWNQLLQTDYYEPDSRSEVCLVRQVEIRKKELLTQVAAPLCNPGLKRMFA